VGADDVFSAFVTKWVGRVSQPAVGAQAIASLEKQLALRLPESYRRFVVSHGTPSTTVALLHSIVEGKHDVHDVSEFIALDELAKATAMYESGGMEPGFLGFATDCMGNMFLFRKADCVAGADDAPVWFFDHDFVAVEDEAPSFMMWLRRFVAIERVDEG
jgi:hypothetical protein